jgi:probable HAF family extracellular repeat protein
LPLTTSFNQDGEESGTMRKMYLMRRLAYALLSVATLSAGLTFGWSQRPSLTWLGTPPRGIRSWAFGVSADGSVVVGSAYNAALMSRALRWVNGVIQDLGTLGGNEGAAYDVSADGSIVVGAASNAVGYPRAFRWTEEGMQDLGTLGGNRSVAYGVSANGSVVVGAASNVAGYSRAFRWTEAGGMQDLGTLGGDRSIAYGVSADGNVIVGLAATATGPWHAFRWTETGGMQDLGTLGGYESYANGVSADGSVVVGVAYIDSVIYHAFRWTLSGGMEDLNIIYADLLNGSELLEASAISPNGRYIVGWGFNLNTQRIEAFLLDTVPEPSNLLVLGVGLVGLLTHRCKRSHSRSMSRASTTMKISTETSRNK